MNIIKPELPIRVQQQQDKLVVFDIIRKKNVPLTPEEWVRQHVLLQLTNQQGISPSRIAVERQVTSTKRRFDILIHHKQTGKPQLLIECKSYQEKIGQKTFNQASVYNQELQVEFMVITNWNQWICAQINQGEVQFLPHFPNIS